VKDLAPEQLARHPHQSQFSSLFSRLDRLRPSAQALVFLTRLHLAQVTRESGRSWRNYHISQGELLAE
jgi:hypothetical protein